SIEASESRHHFHSIHDTFVESNNNAHHETNEDTDINEDTDEDTERDTDEDTEGDTDEDINDEISEMDDSILLEDCMDANEISLRKILEVYLSMKIQEKNINEWVDSFRKKKTIGEANATYH